MRTVRILTVVGVSGGMCVQGVVSGAVPWAPPTQRHPPDPEADTPFGQTDTCENITLPQTSFAGGKYISGDSEQLWFFVPGIAGCLVG